MPLTLWFVIALPGVAISDLAATRAWIAQPVNAIPLLLLVIAALYHSMIGLQVIVEDYVHGALKVVTLLGLQLLHWALAVAAIYSVIVISTGTA